MQGYAYLPTPNTLNYFGSNNAVVPATETLLATYTVPVAKTSTLEYVYGSGETDGRFKLYVNTIAKWVARNAWTQRDIQDTLQYALVAGDVVELKVENLKTTNHFFSGGFYVHEL
jgi:hypothetical protein